MDNLKILLEMLLKMSSLFQGSTNGQMFNQLQVGSDCQGPRAEDHLLGLIQSTRPGQVRLSTVDW